MAISNVKFMSDLHTVQFREALTRDGTAILGVLEKPFIVDFNWDGFRWRLTLPVGYGAAPSIPDLARSLVPATGATWWASFPHDWLYQNASIPRKDADDLFIEIMKDNDAPWYSRLPAWVGIRFGGYYSWSGKGNEITLKGLTKLGPAR